MRVALFFCLVQTAFFVSRVALALASDWSRMAFASQVTFARPESDVHGSEAVAGAGVAGAGVAGAAGVSAALVAEATEVPALLMALTVKV